MAARKLDVFPFGSTQRILIVGDNEMYSRTASRELLKAGFCDVRVTSKREMVVENINESIADLILLDVHLGGELEAGIKFLSLLRVRGYRGIIAVVTGDPSPEEFLSVVKAGANDYLVKGPKLKTVTEVSRFLKDNRGVDGGSWCPDVIARMGFFRSLGLTRREIDILVEYARDFPRHRELARRVGKAETQLRKSFSQIYQKLSASLAVDNPAQLAHLLTICAMCH